jgi:hypothetical protein
MVAKSNIHISLFFLSVAEANAAQSFTCARGIEGIAELDFRRKLAVQMLKNNLDHELVHRSPIRARDARARVCWRG